VFVVFFCTSCSSLHMTIVINISDFYHLTKIRLYGIMCSIRERRSTVVNEVFPGYNKWEPERTPTLSCTFTDEFGNTSTVTKSLLDSTIGEVHAGMKDACRGFGFSESNVLEWFGEDV
jgi:hypothetical protein